MDTNVLTIGQELANTAIALLNLWGIQGSMLGRNTWEIQQDAGAIQLTGWSLLILKPGRFDRESLSLRGYFSEGQFTVQSVEDGDPLQATIWLEKLALFLASEDFQSNVKGCVSRLKKITAALK